MFWRILKRTFTSKWFGHAAFVVLIGYGALVGLGVGSLFGFFFGPDVVAGTIRLIKSDLAKDLFLALICAYAGTSGAQMIAEWNIQRKEALAELRAANSAIVLAFSISHTYLLAKKQVVAGMVEEHKRIRLKYAVDQVRDFTGLTPPNSTFRYTISLDRTDPPYSPLQQLERELLERISTDSASPALILTALVQSVDGFAKACHERNAWIEETKKITDERLRVDMYLGVQQESGHTDLRYPQNLKHLADHTNDCIGYGKVISDRVRSFALKARDDFTRKFGPGAPKIPAPSFHPMVADLLPDMAYYEAFKNSLYPELNSETGA